MKDVQIDKIVPGSALGASLLNEKGSLILNRGTLLTESILNRLRRIGVQALPISCDLETIEQERIELNTALEDRFHGTEGNPFLQELKRLALDHLNHETPESATRDL